MTWSSNSLPVAPASTGVSPDMMRCPWHPIDANGARALTELTSALGAVHTLATSHLPPQLHQLRGACSYLVSAYPRELPLPRPREVTVGGEMLVQRAAGMLVKNDQWAFGTSSNGQVCMAGPFKRPHHHVQSNQVMPIESLFGHTPFSSKP